jgi:hypothetical protein
VGSNPKGGVSLFWDDLILVTEMVTKYGLQEPFADLGGLDRPTIADYALTIASGNQHARYITLKQRPFDHLSKSYLIINPQNGDPPIEELSKTYLYHFGCITCLSVMEHVRNPYNVFDGLYDVTRKGGLVIISTVFSFPYHGAPDDHWRYTPKCLENLAHDTGFTVLEAGWRLEIFGDEGVKDIHTGRAQEIRSVYIAMSKGNLAQGIECHPQLPERILP